MAQLRRSAAGAAATSRGWRGCGFPAMARLRIGLRRERGCDSDFGESAAAIRPRDRGGGRRLHSRPFASLRAALGGGRRGGGDANSALRASNMRRLVSPATPSASALVKLASATPAPRPCVGEWLKGWGWGWGRWWER